jgi:hypothetical protein
MNMRIKAKTTKKKAAATYHKKITRPRKRVHRVREDLSAQMGNYLLEPHPEFGV